MWTQQHILESGDETVYEHTKMHVQMHQGAKKLALEFAASVPFEFEETFVYNNTFFGMDEDRPVLLENYIPGNFVKHVNNNGKLFSP